MEASSGTCGTRPAARPCSFDHLLERERRAEELCNIGWTVYLELRGGFDFCIAAVRRLKSTRQDYELIYTDRHDLPMTRGLLAI